VNALAGQTVTVIAVGDSYTSWEGSKDETTGETRIGLSYSKLCQSVQPGGVILLGDGAISIQVRPLKRMSSSKLLPTAERFVPSTHAGNFLHQLLLQQYVILIFGIFLQPGG
jgi:hypothetical protein